MADKKFPISNFQFQKGTRVYLVGIKGVGMTALAQLLQSRGCLVTGSDGPAKFFTDTVLRRLKIPFVETFAVSNISADVDVVVSSVAYFFSGKALGNNPEVVEALKRKLPLFTYPQALGMLAKEYQVIAVAGSHGKSTTTALLGWILDQAGFEPNVVVGTKVNEWESNAKMGRGPFLVIEADEYRDAFLNYRPYGAIITSIDYDHPDYFKTPAAYASTFKKLVDLIDPRGFLVIEGDSRETKKLAAYAQKKNLKVLTYGFSLANTLCRLVDRGIGRSPGKKITSSKNVLRNVSRKLRSPVLSGAAGLVQGFDILFYGKKISGSIPFPGKQYVANSGAAVATAVMAGMSPEEAVKHAASFPGTARRLEILKKTKAYTIIDDYAHHPTAITITLAGLRAMYPKRKIICIFQPHLFSRTQALFNEFARCFTIADVVGIMEIFPSAREVSGPVSGKDLANETAKHHPNVTYLPDMKTGKQFVKRYAKNGNVIVLMGAGDVYELANA